MAGIKTKQLESSIHQKLSEIMMEMDSKACQEATITEVILNNDNSIAKVYVSFIKNNDEESFFEVKKATSYIRRELAASLNIKKVPFIEMHLDDNLSRINNLEDIIDKANNK